MKKIISTLTLLIFLALVGYLSYTLPQIVFKGGDYPDEVKMAIVLSGICTGVMYFLKDRSQKDS